MYFAWCNGVLVYSSPYSSNKGLYIVRCFLNICKSCLEAWRLCLLLHRFELLIMLLRQAVN